MSQVTPALARSFSVLPRRAAIDLVAAIPLCTPGTYQGWLVARTLPDGARSGTGSEDVAKIVNDVKYILHEKRVMSHHYRFRIQRLFARTGHLFQLRVGMEGEREIDFRPIHKTAFGERLDLEPVHTSLAELQLQLSSLLEWINGRSYGGQCKG